MVRSYDSANGLPPRIYRETSEIRNDIRQISDKIQRTGDMLNIRALLVDLIASEICDEPEKIIPELEGAISEAREALYHLNSLKEELSELESELGDARCLLRR